MHFHGRLDNYLGIGVNNLIKEGAIFTTNINDILVNYPQFANKVCTKTLPKEKVIISNSNYNKKIRTYSEKRIKQEYREIYNAILNGKSSFDDIINNTNEDNIFNVSKKLLNMELERLIKKDISGGYSIIE